MLLARYLGLALWSFVLSGCAGMMAHMESKSLFDEGKVEAGIAKLEEAVKAEPSNPEYRIALTNRRSEQINGHVMAAENFRKEGRLSDAEKSYQLALKYDANHVMAQQGLEAVVTERKHRLLVSEAEKIFKAGGAAAARDALEKLRPVLNENPSKKDALNLKARIDEVLAKEQQPEARLAEIFRKSITLEFRDAPLKAVFDVISKVSGLNFFFDKDIRPDLKTSVLAKNTTVEDAVRLLLVTNQLEQKVLNDNTILVYPNTAQKLQEYQSLSVRAFHLTNSDVKAVSNTIKTIVKTKDMVIDERLGLIILRDTPEAIRLAERIVALQDLSDPEVMLELEVLEIKRSRILDAGIQWPTQLSLSPLQAAGAPLTLEALRNLSSATTQATVGSMNFNLRKENQDGNILANPRIRVRNKDKAKILIGDRVPIITTTSTSTGFVSESINYVDVGLKLEVEPNIYLDEEVAIKVNLEVSSLVREVISKTGSLSYQIGTRGASTVLRLKNGETQVLAGLISDEERSSGTKLPGVGELPLIGRLFGSQKDDSQRSEIVLAITPRIVRTIRRPDLLIAEFESGTANSIGTPALRLGTAEPQKTKEATTPAPAAVTPAAPAPNVSAPAAPPSPTAAAPAQKPQAQATAIPAVSPTAAPAPASTSTNNSPAAGNEANRPRSGAVVTPIAPVSVVGAPPAATGAPVAVAWQMPAQVKAGEQFSAVLKLTSQGPLRGLPMLIGFDPQALQVVSAQEGDFFKQAGGQTNFSHRVDAAQGKVFVAIVRQGSADAGINGNTGVLTVAFKAIKAGQTKIQLLSATPEPAPATPIKLPLEQVIKIQP